MIYIQQLEVGMMKNFNYLIGDPETKECAYVDPAWEVDRLLGLAKKDGYQVRKILLTHRHFDHVEGVEKVVEQTGAEIFINHLDQEAVKKSQGKKILLTAGKEFPIGKLKVVAIHTPGHTPGSTCYLVEDLYLFTGDTLFQGNCGRCDLPGGDSRELFQSLQKLKGLDPTIKVYPGHDYGTKPVTTIDYERGHNPTMRADYFQAFEEIP
ncbi:MAG: MBL fold metallo-hydrolase [Deltaproteobacteria bacterium]|nr:MBL fold metallo-hydrolase [Deltaproteobacteria bacterium]